MTFIVSHYQNDYTWVKDYTDRVHIYTKEIENVGYNISDIMNFIINHYDNLPEVCVFVKDNILSRHITQEEFDVLIKNTTFTPLLTKSHEEREGISFYKDGIYHERNDSWYFHLPHKYFSSYTEFASKMGLPNPEYLPFAPGGNYIVPKENILKRSKEFYKQLREFVSWSQINAESHAVERALYTIWL